MFIRHGGHLQRLSPTRISKVHPDQYLDEKENEERLVEPVKANNEKHHGLTMNQYDEESDEDNDPVRE